MTFLISKPNEKGSYITISERQEEFFDWLRQNGYLADDVTLQEINSIYLGE